LAGSAYWSPRRVSSADPDPLQEVRIVREPARLDRTMTESGPDRRKPVQRAISPEERQELHELRKEMRRKPLSLEQRLRLEQLGRRERLAS